MISTSRFGLAASAFLACVLAPTAASAHLVDIRFGEFYGGTLHLLTGVEYALVLFALSLMASLHKVEAARWMIGAAPLGVLIGALVAMGLPGLQLALVLTLSLTVLGLLAALGKSLPAALMVMIGFCAASLLGYENGRAITGDADALLFLSGLTVSTFVVVTLSLAILTYSQSIASWSRLALRAVGSWIAAVSLIVLALGLQGTAQAGF